MIRVGIIHKQTPPRPESFSAENISKIESCAEDVKVYLCETEDELIEKCPDAEVLICWGVDCPKKWAAGANSLKWIQSVTAGTEALRPIKEMKPHVIITKMTGVHGYPMSESAIMYILMFVNRMPYFNQMQKQHLWQKKLPPFATDDCEGKTVGIVGMGEIGNIMAEKFRFFGMKVLGCRRTPRSTDNADKMYALSDIREMLPLCDFIVSLVPSSPGADGMFNDELFSYFKDGSYFISMGRGIAVDENALINALNSGKLGGAALDVFRKEPLSPDSLLWDNEKVIITPHCSATTPHNFDRAIKTICTNFGKFLNGSLADS